MSCVAKIATHDKLFGVFKSHMKKVFFVFLFFNACSSQNFSSVVSSDSGTDAEPDVLNKNDASSDALSDVLPDASSDASCDVVMPACNLCEECNSNYKTCMANYDGHNCDSELTRCSNLRCGTLCGARICNGI